MHIAILTLTFTLPGCGSLKEKRQRMGASVVVQVWQCVKAVSVIGMMPANGRL